MATSCLDLPKVSGSLEYDLFFSTLKLGNVLGETGAAWVLWQVPSMG